MKALTEAQAKAAAELDAFFRSISEPEAVAPEPENNDFTLGYLAGIRDLSDHLIDLLS